MLENFRKSLFGAPRNLFDPHVHEHLALAAFFAWVGLGSDGLSSSAYGPEEAFRTLGAHGHLAIGLAIAIVLTVFLISASYSQIIELFPTGGGGYLVATRLLGKGPGVLSGCALVVDYVLTVATSVASGCEAIFSFLPRSAAPYKLEAEFLVIAGLTTLNLRGVKESVRILVPIFLAFMVTHTGLLVWGVVHHGSALPRLVGDTMSDTRSAIGQLGLLGTVAIFLRAFSLGGGTFTGIEAVSNGVQLLREPRVRTARHTMLLMATSLSFMAGGILLCYVLNTIHPVEGETMNATLWRTLAGGWRLGPLPIGSAVVWFTLIAEGALLFIAAQTGFIDGPRTMSVMAVDGWLPKRFAHLSERLVTQNGILLMAIATAVTLAYTRGSVSMLVVMYSINVFITFTLSQAGMVRHWWQVRREQGHWRRRLALAALGTLVTAVILAVTSVVKFGQGGWVTLFVSGVLVGLCVLIRGHYTSVSRALRTLDETLTDVPLPDRETPSLVPDGPTAVVLVESYDGLGMHSLLSLQRLFPRRFKNVVFASVGLLDSGRFKGADSVGALEERVRADLERFVDTASRMGYYSEYRYALGTSLLDELEGICRDVAREFRGLTVFAGQLVFERETMFTRLLHAETAFSIQRRLQFVGLPVIILPIRVWEPKTRTA